MIEDKAVSRDIFYSERIGGIFYMIFGIGLISLILLVLFSFLWILTKGIELIELIT